MAVNPIKLSRTLFVSTLVILSFPLCTWGQKRHIPTGGRLAIVVDDHLSAMRNAPSVSAKLIERLGRGRMAAIIGKNQSQDGLTFYRIKISRRRSGWMQSEALISPAHAADDLRLLSMIRSAEEFELIARAQIFLEVFPHSSWRPAVLLLYGDAVEAMSDKLSREAGRRLDQKEMAATGAPEFSYFLNYNALDRYNRQNAHFVFDRNAKKFHYDGAAWREILRRFPHSPEAGEAHKRLEVLAPFLKN